MAEWTNKKRTENKMVGTNLEYSAFQSNPVYLPIKNGKRETPSIAGKYANQGDAPYSEECCKL